MIQTDFTTIKVLHIDDNTVLKVFKWNIPTIKPFYFYKIEHTFHSVKSEIWNKQNFNSLTDLQETARRQLFLLKQYYAAMEETRDLIIRKRGKK